MTLRQSQNLCRTYSRRRLTGKETTASKGLNRMNFSQRIGAIPLTKKIQVGRTST
jgi:hypothetical protein